VCLRVLVVDGRARAARVRVRVCESRVYRFAGDKVIDCVVRHSRRARNDGKRDSRGGRRLPRPRGVNGTARRSDATDGRFACGAYSYVTRGGRATCVSSARQTCTARQTESAFRRRRDRGRCGNRSNDRGVGKDHACRDRRARAFVILLFITRPEQRVPTIML